ncbi:hypothetical protein NMG60_11035158 [Bertholletia excelsa]
MESVNKEKANVLPLDGGEIDRNSEEEDEKMDKFFALIKSFRDARHRRMEELKKQNTTQNSPDNKNKKRKAEHGQGQDQDRGQPSWVPSFQLEDFLQEVEFRSPPLTFPAPRNNRNFQQQSDEIDKDTGLDLRLTL